MHTKTANRRALAYLLLFTLIFSAASNYVINSTTPTSRISLFDIPYASTMLEHSNSAMSGGTNASFDYAEASDSYINVFSSRLSSLQNLKINIPFLIEAKAVEASCFIYYSRLSHEIFIYKNICTIINFLHKKDGKK